MNQQDARLVKTPAGNDVFVAKVQIGGDSHLVAVPFVRGAKSLAIRVAHLEKFLGDRPRGCSRMRLSSGHWLQVQGLGVNIRQVKPIVLAHGLDEQGFKVHVDGCIAQHALRVMTQAAGS